MNNDVDNSDYTEWELGYKRNTTNEEYRQKYKAIYDEESDYETVYRINTTDGQHPHITTIVPVKNNDEDVVEYRVTVFDNGKADVQVRCKNRDAINYRGHLVLEEGIFLKYSVIFRLRYPPARV